MEIKISKRRLPLNRTAKHNQIIKNVDEFFGNGCSPGDKRMKKDIYLWLMNRKKGVELNEEQKEAVWFIKSNLAAKES